MPRPKLPPSEKKTSLFTAKMASEDYIEFQAAAEAFGSNMSKLFSQWAVETIAEAKSKYPDRFERALDKYRALAGQRAEAQQPAARPPARRPSAKKGSTSKKR
jgi:hypothetical protein